MLYRRGVAAGRIENREHDGTSAVEQPKSPQNGGDAAQPVWQPPSELDYRNERACDMLPMPPGRHELE